MALPDWPAIRAFLLLFVIALNALSATPAPTRLGASHLGRPDASEELDAWVSVLAAVGFEVPRDRLADATVVVVNTWVDARAVAIGQPTRVLRRWLGIRQNWALFARPDTWPSALVVEVDGPGGDWVPVYRSLDPDHALLAPQLRYRRIRGIYDVGDRPGAGYHNLTRWLAGEVFDARPEARRVRVRLVRSHTTRPGQPTDPTQKVFGEVVHERAKVRP